MSDTLGDVQTNLTHRLEKLIQLSDDIISWLSPRSKTASDVRKADLKQKIDDVKNLQIRMTIVAPMKTGKSTILNAIIGDEILPIHDEAMTALPTEIVLQYNNEQHVAGEPCLWLTETCRNILKELQAYVYTSLNRTRVNDLDKNLNFNSHLIATTKKIYERNNATDWLAEKTTGSENINELLRYINDLVHIFTFLHPSNVGDSSDQSTSILLTKFAQNIPTVQILNTPSETGLLASASPVTSRPYRLILVDTPGPNEETTADRLKEVIEEEIKKADIVLVALDYTALGTEADAKIAEAVRKVHQIKDPSYVYAVVNKVDQRQVNGKSKEDVRKHIAMKYEIHEENVFELKARYGLIARRFLAAYSKSSENKALLPIEQSPTARDVIRQFYPIDFEDKINKIEPKELHKLAEQLYNISGIPDLLTSAIARIKGEIIRRCIQSAFRMGRNIYDELQQDIRLRREHLNQKAEDLKNELNDLRHAQRTVHEIEKHFDDAIATKDVISKLETRLQSIFTKAKGMILDDINTLFNEKNKRWLDQTKWRPYLYTKRIPVATISVGGTIAGSILALAVALPAAGVAVTVGGVATVGVYFHSSGIIEFDKYEDAEKFIDYLIEKTNGASAKSYQTVSEQVCTACNDALQSIQKACAEKINEIAKKVKQRFDRNMEFPRCSIPVFELDLQHIASKSIPISCRYRPLFGLVPFTYSCGRDTHTHTRFHISRQELYEKCETSIIGNMGRIKDEVDEKCREQMRKIVTDQLTVFHSFLRKCEEDIKEYVLNNESNETDVEETKQQLDSLKKTLDDERNKFDECCTSFQNDYMTTTTN